MLSSRKQDAEMITPQDQDAIVNHLVSRQRALADHYIITMCTSHCNQDDAQAFIVVQWTLALLVVEVNHNA